MSLAKEVDKKNGDVNFIGVEIRKYKDGIIKTTIVRNNDTTDEEILNLLTKAMTTVVSDFKL